MRKGGVEGGGEFGTVKPRGKIAVKAFPTLFYVFSQKGFAGFILVEYQWDAVKPLSWGDSHGVHTRGFIQTGFQRIPVKGVLPLSLFTSYTCNHTLRR